MRAVDVGAERSAVLDVRADPVQPPVARRALNDTEDGDERSHRGHGPDRAPDLLAGTIRVVTDEEEGGDGRELQEIPSRLVGVRRPAGDELECREREKERRRQPAGR